MSDRFTNVDNSSPLANELFDALTTGLNIPAPPDFSDPKFTFTPDTSSDLYSAVVGVDIVDVTEGENTLSGKGAFDVFMVAMDKHLEREFKGNRITGTQYAEVYTAVSNQVLAQAVSFELQKDQAKWNAVTAQMQARVAEIQATEALIRLEQSKIEAANANFQLNLTAAQYALTKMQTATEEANHDSVTADIAIKEFQRTHQQPADLSITQYERTQVMPSTVAMNKIQVDRILPAQAAIAEFQNRNLQPIEEAIQQIQRDRIVPAQADVEEFRRDNMLPIELAQQQHIVNSRQPAETNLVLGQVNLIKEQFEAERAKTLDIRSDGAVVVGSIGKQKDLYTQQIDSFVKDAQFKVGKLYSDAWITQKTLNDVLQAPTQYTNAEVDEVLIALRANNNLGS